MPLWCLLTAIKEKKRSWGRFYGSMLVPGPCRYTPWLLSSPFYVNVQCTLYTIGACFCSQTIYWGSYWLTFIFSHIKMGNDANAIMGEIDVYRNEHIHCILCREESNPKNIISFSSSTESIFFQSFTTTQYHWRHSDWYGRHFNATANKNNFLPTRDCFCAF